MHPGSGGLTSRELLHTLRGPTGLNVVGTETDGHDAGGDEIHVGSGL